jgi:cytoskeleton protein RodZ
VGRIAAQLHLRPAQVEELERDHFDSFDARVFVRGYLRNYARLVSLPAESVLEAFDALHPDPQEPELKRVGSHRPQVSSRHGVVRLVSWALLLGILGLFVVWWAGYLQINGGAGVPGEAVQQPAGDAQSPQLPLSEPGGEGELSLPPTAEPAGLPPADVAGKAGNPPAGSAPVARDVQPAVPQEPETAAETESRPVAPAANPAVALSLAGPCWVEIRATDGSYKLLGEFQAGTHRVLGGNPPYRIVLGNASVATLSVDGSPVDLAPYTSKQIARFILDPAGQ